MPSFTASYEQGLATFETAEDSEATVISMGLHHAERPLDEHGNPATLPKLPDLAECNSQELTYWLGVFTEWASYAAGRLTYFTKLAESALGKKEYAWSYLRRQHDGTVSDKDDAVRTDVRYQQVLREYLYTANVVMDLRCITDSLETQIKTISRAVTLMEQRLGTEGYAATAESRARRGRDAVSHFVNRKPRP